MSLSLKTIKPKETAVLRQSVLRPHQTIEEMAYPNDEIDGAIHIGAFENDELVGIVSIYPETEDGNIEQREVWRLRGMATSPVVRGKGYGKLLVEKALVMARESGGELLWCNARTTACGFYLHFGFEKKGDEFDIEGIGPHYVMTYPLKN